MLGSFVSPLDFGSSKAHKSANTTRGSSTSSKIQTRTPAKENAAATSRDSSSSTVTPPSSILARTALALEYASLRHQNHCPLGMYVVPTPDNIFIWNAVVLVHQGYYAGAILRFRLTFPSDYPERMPTVQFDTDIFHPLIDSKGYFNLEAHFRPWKPKEHHVYHVLYYIKAAFKKYRLDQFKENDAWNKEAYRYHEATSSFAALATQSSQLTRSESALFDKDHPSFTGQPIQGLVFQKLTSEQLSSYRQQLGLQEWVEGSENE